MNILSVVMACFAILGAIDKVTGNHLGIGKEFERGVFTRQLKIFPCDGRNACGSLFFYSAILYLDAIFVQPKPRRYFGVRA